MTGVGPLVTSGLALAMTATIWSIDAEHPQPRVVEKAVSVLASGGLVAFPTDTYYALACDLFELRGPEGGAIDPARWRAARADLQGVLVDKVDLEELMARRLKASPLPARPLPRVATKVVIDNDSSRHHSVVDVFTADRVGLLHTLSRTFFDLGLTVDLARITTEGHRAADAFYVRNRNGRRVEGAEAKRITDALTQALTRN